MKNKQYLLSISFWASLVVLALATLVAEPALADGIAKNWQLGLQEAASPIKERIDAFHNILLIVISAIVAFVTLLLAYVVIRFRAKANPEPSKTTHNTMLEVIWTAIPVLILVVIVIPSMKLLYYSDKAVNAEMTIKVTGYQWYWGYEYPDHGNFQFMSYILQEDELKEGQPRLLTTDTAVVVPVDTPIRVLVTAADVLHSWAVPALGVKMDAVPGRMNETWIQVNKEGVYYGQCSELCGTGHGFMPIMVKAVSKEEFASWVEENGGTMNAAEEVEAEEESSLINEQETTIAKAGE